MPGRGTLRPRADLLGSGGAAAPSAPLPQAVDRAVPAERGAEFRILYVGHILPYKALDTLLEAVHHLRARVGRPVRAYLTIAREDWPEGFDAFVARRDALGLAEAVT